MYDNYIRIENIFVKKSKLFDGVHRIYEQTYPPVPAQAFGAHYNIMPGQ